MYADGPAALLAAAGACFRCLVFMFLSKFQPMLPHSASPCRHFVLLPAAGLLAAVSAVFAHGPVCVLLPLASMSALCDSVLLTGLFFSYGGTPCYWLAPSSRLGPSPGVASNCRKGKSKVEFSRSWKLCTQDIGLFEKYTAL